ncbi:MAG: (4Fe-4S)-binding protein [Actinomycetota bacterium]
MTTNGGNQVKVTVNQDVCIASGQCEMIEPDVFLIDDETVIAGIVGDPMMSRDRAEQVADRCPSGAITFAEDVEAVEQ